MPSYVCRTTCQYRNEDDKIKYVEAGSVVDVEPGFEMPMHFECLEGPEVKVNFATASEEELLVAEWTYAEADASMQRLYKKKLKKGDKPNVIAQILDIRYRNTSSGDAELALSAEDAEAKLAADAKAAEAATGA